MTSTERFITSITKTAKREATVLPWVRGKRRAAFIAKRTAGPLRKTA